MSGTGRTVAGQQVYAIQHSLDTTPIVIQLLKSIVELFNQIINSKVT